MRSAESRFPEEQNSEDKNDREDTQKLRAITSPGKTSTLEREKADSARSENSVQENPGETKNTMQRANLQEEGAIEVKGTAEVANEAQAGTIEAQNSPRSRSSMKDGAIEEVNTPEIDVTREAVPTEAIDIDKIKTSKLPGEVVSAEIDTSKQPASDSVENRPTAPMTVSRDTVMPRGRAILFAAFLIVLIVNATFLGSGQLLGAQGWAYVLGGPAGSDPHLLNNITHRLHLTPAHSTPITPQQYINLIVQGMSLDQKLGQMMIVQFTGPSYSLDLSTMVTQYNVGAVVLFGVNQNIQDRSQLKGLIQQMQSNSSIPLTVAIDQEGGTVDRLIDLDGQRSSASEIGATNDPNKAKAAGIQDAKDLAYYGINLNLAPVVDVNAVYNPQLYMRTFGNDPASVTKMAGAYLQGLQQSGKVAGTLKHFPGLGDVAEDPHNSVPYLLRSKSDLETIDWAPYRSLIAQGNVYAVMVTHEIVTALDSSKPSSLSNKVVTGILRNELGFQGVIMTDSLTMEGITAYYDEAQATVLAVEAGSDLLMGATDPSIVAKMINGLKQAVSSGEISQQRIDDSVRRILMLKYQMGILHIPTN